MSALSEWEEKLKSELDEKLKSELEEELKSEFESSSSAPKSLGMQQEEEMEIYNLPMWVKDNEPIYNKLMFNEQLNIMFVGSPNMRRDYNYHIECGEEFFYQIKGNMDLLTRQRGRKKTVHIKEGEIYLLRARVPHSVQRSDKDSLGLVVERRRVKGKELDCIRYYVNDFDPNEQDENKILWEKWFYCSDSGTELPSVRKEFYDSEEFKTHIPKNISLNPPHEINNSIDIAAPFDLYEFIEENKGILEKNKQLNVLSGTQTTVSILTGGKCEFRRKCHQQTWVYCMKVDDTGMDSMCRVTFYPPSRRGMAFLVEGDCILINKSEQYQIAIDNPKGETLVMTVSMDVTEPIPRSSKI